MKTEKKTAEHSKLSIFGVSVRLYGNAAEQVAQTWTSWGVGDFPACRHLPQVRVELLPLSDDRQLEVGKLIIGETGSLPIKVAYDISGCCVIIKHRADDSALPLTVARQIFCILSLFSSSVFIFHSSSASKPDESANLFCGPSGAGKSTLVNTLLPESWRVIDEEFNVVLQRIENNRPKIYVLDFPNGSLHPLAEIFWLKHAAPGDPGIVNPLSSAKLAARSMALPALDIPRELLSKALANRAAMLYSLQRSELIFPLNADAVEQLLD